MPLEVRTFENRRTVQFGEVTLVTSLAGGAWRQPQLLRREPPLELDAQCEAVPPESVPTFATREACEREKPASLAVTCEGTTCTPNDPSVLWLEGCEPVLRQMRADADRLSEGSHEDRLATLNALIKAKRLWSMVDERCVEFAVKREGDQQRLISEPFEMTVRLQPIDHMAWVFMERTGLGMRGWSGGERRPLMLGKDVFRLGERWFWLKRPC